MNAEVAAYFDSLGLTDALRFRLDSLVSTYEDLLGVELESAFVSEYIADDQGHVYEDLWGFTSDLIMEAVISAEDGDQYDFVPLRRSVRHWIVKAKDYAMGAATESSRLSVKIWVADAKVARLRASGANCDKLMNACRRYVIPNLAPLAAIEPTAQP